MKLRYYVIMFLLGMSLPLGALQAQVPPHPIYTTNKDAANVYALAVDLNSSDGLKILAGTGSIDDPSHPQGGSVHESLDLGKNWPLNNPLFYGYPIRALLVLGANEYLAGAFQDSPAKAGSSPGIFYTNDSGANWQQVLHGEQITSFAEVSIGGTKVYFAGTQDGDVYALARNNPSFPTGWVSLVNLSRPVLSLATIISSLAPYLYVGTDGDGLHRYNIGLAGSTVSFSGHTTFLSGKVVSALEVYDASTDADDRVFAGTDDGMWRSDGYGAFAQKLFEAWIRALHHMEIVGWSGPPGAPGSIRYVTNYIFAGAFASSTGFQEGGVYVSSDWGESWVKLDNGLQSKHILSITNVGDNWLFIGTKGEGIHRMSVLGLEFRSDISPSPGTEYIEQLISYGDDNFYAKRNDDKVFQSTDGGSTWTPLGANTITAIGLKEGTLYGGEGNVLKRWDGSNWITVGTAAGATTIHYIFPAQDGNLYIGTNSGVYRYNGSTVSAFSTGLTGPVFLFTQTPSGVLFAVKDASPDEVYYLSGTTWVQATALPAGVNTVNAIAADYDNRVFIGTDQGLYSIFDTDYDGQYNDEAWRTELGPGDIIGGKIVDPSIYSLLRVEDNALVAGGVDRVYYRAQVRNRPESGWLKSPVNPFTFRVEVRALGRGDNPYYDPTDSTTGQYYIYGAMQDGRFFRSKYLQWDQVTHIDRNVAINAVEVVDANIFLGTYGYGVLHARTEDAPTNNWTELNRGLDNPWVYSLLHKPQITSGGVTTYEYLFAGTWNGGVYRRPLKRDGSGHINDLGTSWQQVGATSLTGLIIYDMDYAPTGRIFAATSLGEIAYSDNDGLTWTKVAFTDTLNRRINTAIYALQVDRDSYAPGNPDRCTIYAGTFGYGIFKSTDCGLTWSQTGLINKHVWEITIDYDRASGAAKTLIAATSEGVWQSTDEGATWTDITGNLTSFFPYSRDVRSVFLYDGVVLWAGVYGGGLYRMTDTDNDADYSDETWVNDGFEGMHILSFAVHPDTKDLLVLTPNELWVLPTATATASEGDAIGVPKELDLLQNYPNPFDGKTVISFTLPKAGEVEVKVFDILGREVATVVSGRFQAGVHRVTWESGRLPSGVYIYQLRADGRTKTRKMMIVH